MTFFEWIQNMDLSVVRFVREYVSCDFLDFLVPKITLFGEDGIFWIIVSLCLLAFGKTRKVGFAMGLSLIFGLVVGNLTMKPLIGRIRPYEIDGVAILVEKLSDGSFPSGHTMCCFEGAVSLLLFGCKKWGRPALVLAFLVALSRIYLYVHFPTDVIVGALLGWLFAFVSCKIVTKIYEKVKKTKSL